MPKQSTYKKKKGKYSKSGKVRAHDRIIVNKGKVKTIPIPEHERNTGIAHSDEEISKVWEERSSESKKIDLSREAKIISPHAWVESKGTAGDLEGIDTKKEKTKSNQLVPFSKMSLEEIKKTYDIFDLIEVSDDHVRLQGYIAKENDPEHFAKIVEKDSIYAKKVKGLSKEEAQKTLDYYLDLISVLSTGKKNEITKIDVKTFTLSNLDYLTEKINDIARLLRYSYKPSRDTEEYLEKFLEANQKRAEDLEKIFQGIKGNFRLIDKISSRKLKTIIDTNGNLELTITQKGKIGIGLYGMVPKEQFATYLEICKKYNGSYDSYDRKWYFEKNNANKVLKELADKEFSVAKTTSVDKFEEAQLYDALEDQTISKLQKGDSSTKKEIKHSKKIQEKLAELRSLNDGPSFEHLQTEEYTRYYKSNSGKEYVEIGRRMWNKKKRTFTFKESASLMFWIGEDGKLKGKAYANRPGMYSYPRNFAEEHNIELVD